MSKIYFNDRPEGLTNWCLIPGSFNPVHAGHLALGLYCESQKIEPVYEISLPNCDKPDISLEEAKKRARQLTKFGFPVIIDELPYFTEKWAYFKPTYIAVGVDTWNRFVALATYNHNEHLQRYTFQNCRSHFLIFPRPGYRFSVLNNSSLTYTYLAGFEQINISSTELRTFMENPK